MVDTEVSVTSAASSAWIPLNHKQKDFQVSYALLPTGTVSFTWKMEGTLHNVFDSTVTPVAFELTSATGSTTTTDIVDGVITQPVRAVRLTVAPHTSGTATLKVLQGR